MVDPSHIDYSHLDRLEILMISLFEGSTTTWVPWKIWLRGSGEVDGRSRP
jgi:hypothetical protein